MDRHKNKVARFISAKYFSDANKSVVVLANPKSILNTKFAKKADKEKVIRADRIKRQSVSVKMRILTRLWSKREIEFDEGDCK